MSNVLTHGTGTGVYRGFRYHIYQHDSAPHPTDEWPDLAAGASLEQKEMIADYEEGGHVYYFTIDGLDPEHWGSYYYGKHHESSGLMYDIILEIDNQLGGAT